MEILIGFVAIVGLLVLLDIAALKWGKNSSQMSWLRNDYDPRYNWNKPDENQP